MRHWERDLADHLVMLMLMHSDETLDEVLADLKNDLPSFPSEEAVRAAYVTRLDPKLGKPGPVGH